MLSHCSINAENLKPASANMKSYDLSNVFNALKLVHKSALLLTAVKKSTKDKNWTKY